VNPQSGVTVKKNGGASGAAVFLMQETIERSGAGGIHDQASRLRTALAQRARQLVGKHFERVFKMVAVGLPQFAF
jgi:hypothetical protein